MQVDGQPDLHDVTTSTSWMTVVKSTIADDVIAMVTASEQVAMDVAMALGEFNREVLVAVSLPVVFCIQNEFRIIFINLCLV